MYVPSNAKPTESLATSASLLFHGIGCPYISQPIISLAYPSSKTREPSALNECVEITRSRGDVIIFPAAFEGTGASRDVRGRHCIEVDTRVALIENQNALLTLTLSGKVKPR